MGNYSSSPTCNPMISNRKKKTTAKDELQSNSLHVITASQHHEKHPSKSSHQSIGFLPSHPNGNKEKLSLMYNPSSQHLCDNNSRTQLNQKDLNLTFYNRHFSGLSNHPSDCDFQQNIVETALQSESRPEYEFHRHKANHSFGGYRAHQPCSASTIAANPNLGGPWQPPGGFILKDEPNPGVPASALHARGEVISIQLGNNDDEEEQTPRLIDGSDTTSSDDGTQHLTRQLRGSCNDSNNRIVDRVNSSKPKESEDRERFKSSASDRMKIGYRLESSVIDDPRLLQGTHGGIYGVAVATVKSRGSHFPIDVQLQHGHFHSPHIKPSTRLGHPFSSASAAADITVDEGSLESRRAKINESSGFNNRDANGTGSTALPISGEGTLLREVQKNISLRGSRLRSTSAGRIEIVLKPVPKGYAVKSYRNGDRYEGELVRGKRDGYGLTFMSNGEAYAGQWLQDVRNGRGIQFYSPWGRYEGDFRLDQRSGWGMLVMRRHGTFFGQFLNNKKHGKGILIHPRGEVFAEWWNLGKLVKRVWLRELLVYTRRVRELCIQDINKNRTDQLSPTHKVSTQHLPSDIVQRRLGCSGLEQYLKENSVMSEQPVEKLSASRCPGSRQTAPAEHLHSRLHPSPELNFASHPTRNRFPSLQSSFVLNSSSCTQGCATAKVSLSQCLSVDIVPQSSNSGQWKSDTHPFECPTSLPVHATYSRLCAPLITVPETHRWKNHISLNELRSPDRPAAPSIYHFRNARQLGPIAESSLDASPGSATNRSASISLHNEQVSFLERQDELVSHSQKFSEESATSDNHDSSENISTSAEADSTIVLPEPDSINISRNTDSIAKLKPGRLDSKVENFIPQFNSVISTVAPSTLQTPLYTSGLASSQYTSTSTTACLVDHASGLDQNNKSLTHRRPPCLCLGCSPSRHPSSNSVMSAFVGAVGRRSEDVGAHHRQCNNLGTVKEVRRNSYQIMRRRIGSDSGLTSSKRTFSESSLPQIGTERLSSLDAMMSERLLRSAGYERDTSLSDENESSSVERCNSLPEESVLEEISCFNENNLVSHSFEEALDSIPSSHPNSKRFMQFESFEMNATKYCLNVSLSERKEFQIRKQESADITKCGIQIVEKKEWNKRNLEAKGERMRYGSFQPTHNLQTQSTQLQPGLFKDAISMLETRRYPANVNMLKTNLLKKNLDQSSSIQSHLIESSPPSTFRYEDHKNANNSILLLSQDRKQIYSGNKNHSEEICQVTQASTFAKEKEGKVLRSPESSIISSTFATDDSALPQLRKWTIDDVGEFLNCLGLEHLASVFQRNQIGGEELINLTEDDLENELRIRDATHRQLLVQAAQALSRCESKRRFQGQPWVAILRCLRDLFRECLISSTALRRSRLVGEGGFGIVYRGLWGGDAEVAIKAFRVSAFPAIPQPQTQKNFKKEETVVQRTQVEGAVGQPFNERRSLEVSKEVRVHEKKRQHEERLLARQRHRLALMLSDLADEAKVLMSLRHPNVTRFWGVCLDTERQWLVTQYVPGGSLFGLIHSSRGVLLDSFRITKIALGICSGMAYVHSKGLLHCDLKSPNILLDENLEPKICDFGLALRTLDCPTAATRGRIGTPQWMAPEVLRGAEYSKAADVYSFGVILWEMLSRRVPHANMTLNHVMAAVGWGNHRLDAVYHCPEPLSRIMKKCLHRIHTQRPAFEVLVDDFSSLVDSDELETETGRLLAKPFRKLKETTRRTLNSVEGMIFGPPL